MSRRVVGASRGRTTARVYEGRSPTVNDARLRAPRLLRYIDGGVGKPSLSSVQATVAIAAGVLSVLGGVYSFWQHIKPVAGTGQVVAILREGRSDRPVTGATVEVLTEGDELVATLTSPDSGRLQQALKEVMRSAAGSTPVGEAVRAVDEGVGAVRRFFRDLGGSR